MPGPAVADQVVVQQAADFRRGRGGSLSGDQDGGCGLIAVSAALIAAKDTVNWLTGVPGEFGDKAKTAPLAAPAALAMPTGVGIIVVGVLEAL